MMWDWTMVSVILLLIMSMTFMKNPVKLSLLLMASVTIMSLDLINSTSNTWWPTIFYMLFLGGILVMFLILSTIMPNEKMEKETMNKVMILTLSLLFLIMSMSSSLSSNLKMGDTQWTLQSFYNLEFMTLLIIIYFVMFTILISMEKSSLRTIV